MVDHFRDYWFWSNLIQFHGTLVKNNKEYQLFFYCLNTYEYTLTRKIHISETNTKIKYSCYITSILYQKNILSKHPCVNIFSFHFYEIYIFEKKLFLYLRLTFGNFFSVRLRAKYIFRVLLKFIFSIINFIL